MSYLDIALRVAGAVSGLCSALALLFPAGSRLGKLLGRIGTDFKGHNK